MDSRHRQVTSTELANTDRIPSLCGLQLSLVDWDWIAWAHKKKVYYLTFVNNLFFWQYKKIECVDIHIMIHISTQSTLCNRTNWASHENKIHGLYKLTRALLVGLQHCQLVEFCKYQGTFWLPWQQSGYHGIRSPWQQLLSNPMPLLIKFHSLFMCFMSSGEVFWLPWQRLSR